MHPLLSSKDAFLQIQKDADQTFSKGVRVGLITRPNSFANTLWYWEAKAPCPTFLLVSLPHHHQKQSSSLIRQPRKGRAIERPGGWLKATGSSAQKSASSRATLGVKWLPLSITTGCHPQNSHRWSGFLSTTSCSMQKFPSKHRGKACWGTWGVNKDWLPSTHWSGLLSGATNSKSLYCACTMKGLHGLAGCCGPWTPALVQHSSWEAAFKLPWGKWGEGRASFFWAYWVLHHQINAPEYSPPFKSYGSRSPPVDDRKLSLPALKHAELQALWKSFTWDLLKAYKYLCKDKHKY